MNLLTISSFIARLLWSCGIWCLVYLEFIGLCLCLSLGYLLVGNVRFGHHCNGDIWMVVPHCLLWCIWKERNSKCFEDIELPMSDISSYFSELYWTSSLCGGIFLFLLFWIFLTFVMFVLDLFTPVYSPCTWVSLSFYYQ